MVKIKLNYAGVGELLKSPQMRAICEQHAVAVRARCGDGYEHDSYAGQNRANAMVWPSSAQAKRDNARNNTILKALK